MDENVRFRECYCLHDVTVMDMSNCQIVHAVSLHCSLATEVYFSSDYHME